MAAGKEHGIQTGHTSSIRRIEGGMLSYHADADIYTNPFELGLVYYLGCFTCQTRM